MDLKLVLFVVVLILTFHQNVDADFFYNRVHPKPGQLSFSDLKCVPGRTIIKMQNKPAESNESDDYDGGGYGKNDLRSHMRWQTDDPSCQICVCSVEGKDEYCSKRPAMNVNECIRMGALIKSFKKNDPYEHERSLSYRIRRDYIWHNDEIPYESKAKCHRGHSYYSNSVNANDTDIDIASDIESLLEYSNKGICYYCVCSMDGNAAGCLSRSPWFCEYFRFLRERNAQRDTYTRLFQQDRPSYFRSISWRLRRTMDTGMFDLLENGGDALCCDHPNGHRRHLHHHIKNKIRLIKKKVNKENLMSGASGGDYVDFVVNNDKKKLGNGGESQSCVPFVSEYTDCTENNLCSGCQKCVCTGEGKWNCNDIRQCPDDSDDFKDLDDEDLDHALKFLHEELKNKEIKDKADSENPLVPVPENIEDLVLEKKEFNMEEEILELMRSKRSVDEKVQGDEKENDTIKFHHAVDELNQDTLKDLNVSGTLPAQKTDTLPKISRRTSLLNNLSNALQIEYTQRNEKKHHDDNKVDTLAIHDDKEDLLIHGNVFNVLGNHSQNDKDKELSKLLVNELKGGVSETIGDKNAPVISNITFTPENDTLTAMAFIAGNLLNKLWNIEKDANDDQIDTELLKHEKIADLLDLFKEPLSIRQETFLNNALKQLSTALSQNKDDIYNISLCKYLEGKKLPGNTKKSTPNVQEADCTEEKSDKIKNQNRATVEALDKINNVLDLIKKYENVQNRMSNLNSGKFDNILRTSSGNNTATEITENEQSSLDLYGNTLETITKLLIPKKKNKKVAHSLKNSNLFSTGKDLKNKLSNMKLDQLNITTKDKMILDYLAHIQSNPDCLLKKMYEKVSLPSIEGNILLNLSEFFKIKSLADLVKLVETEKRPDPALRSPTVTTKNPMKKLTTESIVKTNLKQFGDTKERLKGHLKSILEDLIELQKIEGKDSKSKDIMEAMPCIYNLLNAGKKEVIKPMSNLDKSSTLTDRIPSDKISQIFSKLKNELKFSQTRRTSTLGGSRPKSAIVWERTIKNTEGKPKFQARRNLGKTPKTIEELKVIMDKIDSSGSNTYKNYAFLTKVPLAERLLLLKTFNADTMRYVKALETIMASLKDVSITTKDGVDEINEFIDNVAVNINLNEKVIRNIDKPKKVYEFNRTSYPKRLMRNQEELKLQLPNHLINSNSEPNSYSTKLTKEQIINQLIKNRIQLYVETKEAAQETQNDMNYNVAKKILSHVELGNFQIAREIYKVFVSLNQKDFMNAKNKNIGIVREQTNKFTTRRRPLQVEPLMKFENPRSINKDAQIIDQDHFIKQLLNLKNMKL